MVKCRVIGKMKSNPLQFKLPFENYQAGDGVLFGNIEGIVIPRPEESMCWSGPALEAVRNPDPNIVFLAIKCGDWVGWNWYKSDEISPHLLECPLSLSDLQKWQQEWRNQGIKARESDWWNRIPH